MEDDDSIDQDHEPNFIIKTNRILKASFQQWTKSLTINTAMTYCIKNFIGAHIVQELSQDKKDFIITLTNAGVELSKIGSLVSSK